MSRHFTDPTKESARFEPVLDASAFRRIAGHWVTGVAVITTIDKAGNPLGLTMNGLTSLSLSPPRFLVCFDNGSETLAALRISKIFCINFLHRDQQALSSLFATKSANKFSGVEWTKGLTGAPVLSGAIGHMELRLSQLLCGGDHQIAIGEAVAADTRTGEPLVYFNGEYRSVA
jgi:flavin reductase (DIM6/NTAB) family NADH-FMN oxidoreductase RutF